MDNLNSSDPYTQVNDLLNRAAQLSSRALAVLEQADAMRKTASALLREAEDLKRRAVENRPHPYVVKVCDHWRVPLVVLLGRSRTQKVTVPRMVAAYLLVHRAGMTTIAAGRELNRDHSTVIHACDVVERRIAAGPAFAAIINALVAANGDDVCSGLRQAERSVVAKERETCTRRHSINTINVPNHERR